MPAIFDLRVRPNRKGHNIGHRTLAAGEVLARLQFRSDEDAKFFINHLRWSAFESVAVDPAAAVPEVEGAAKAAILSLQSRIAELEKALAYATAQLDAEPVVVDVPTESADATAQLDKSKPKPRK